MTRLFDISAKVRRGISSVNCDHIIVNPQFIKSLEYSNGIATIFLADRGSYSLSMTEDEFLALVEKLKAGEK